MRQQLRDTIRFAPHLLRFGVAYAKFLREGKTSNTGFHSLRQLYCITNGRFNDWVGKVHQVIHPPYDVQRPAGILGELTKADVDRIVADLDREGYHVFEQKLPPALCDELTEFALTTPSVPQDNSADGRQAKAVVYDRQQPASVRQEFEMQTLFENPTVQRMTTDPGLLAIAQGYLKFKPVLDLAAMWWSAAGFKEGQSKAAQLYHFDMDRIRFLKFFFYLTDVTPDTGPHCYVAGSHHRKPRALLRDGRIQDEEIAAHYDPSRIKEICGPRGTIIAADTRGWHKGKPLVSGDRLLFQIQFADGLFGQNYPPVEVNDRFGEAFTRFADRYRRTYSNFVPPSPAAR